jgi:hypothetical protein
VGLVAVVALAAVGFVTLSFTSGDAAQASDDWTSGHSSYRTCSNYRTPYAYAYASRGRAGTVICWSYGYDVSVQGGAKDLKGGDGRCAVDRIRYQIRFSDGSWSAWHHRIMATACGLNSTKISSWWWSTHKTANVQMQACLRDGRYGAVLGWSCSGWK